MKSSLCILGLADLHDRVEMLDRLRDVDADLIAFCGDLHNGSSRTAGEPVAAALARLGLPVLIVPGNMDHKDVVPQMWREAGLIMLHRSSFRFGDFGFIGMGGMAVHNPRRLEDPARYYHRDGEVYDSLAQAYPGISGSKTIIVLTHQPPRDTRDTIYTGERTGCISLRRFLEEYQPDLLLCGHIHEDRGESQVGPTRIINVGELRQGYAAIIELNGELAVDWIEL
jgi:Icc-related predicted phosphoesterase